MITIAPDDLDRVQLVMKFVVKHYPETIDFDLSLKVFARIAKLIDVSSFEELKAAYGRRFLIAILSYYERSEEYEKCAAIVKCISK